MRDEKSMPARPVLYSPPAPEALDAFARKVCHGLGADYSTPDVMDGFSAFIKVAVEIQAKRLSKQQNGEAS